MQNDHLIAVALRKRLQDRRQRPDSACPEDEVHRALAPDDLFAALLGDATGDADPHRLLAGGGALCVEALEPTEAAELREELVLGLFAHAAGVQQHDVGVIG